MKIDSLEISADLRKVLDKLQNQLRMTDSPYLKKRPRRSGDYYIIQCPYHKGGQENHPSAQLRENDGLFYCFNCKKSRNFFDFITDVTEENGREWLINNFNSVEITERDVQFDLTRNKDKQVKQIEYISSEEYKPYRRTHEYMYTRKLTFDIIRKFDIGYDEDFVLNITDDKGKIINQKHIGECITFPNKDINGHILFIARRAINQKFFHYPENVDKPIYGLFELKREIEHGKDIKEVYVCESMLDALVIWTYGKYAIALNGTGSAEQYKMLREIDFIRTYILATDNDKAGKFAREKFRNQVKNKFIKEIDYKSYGNCKDINDMEKEQFLNANIIL